MLSSIFSVILSMLHILYSAWKYLKSMWFYNLRKSDSAVPDDCSEAELKFISSSVKQLCKIPAHLAIIIVNESISYKDLANIILWCFAARISSVSFHDHTGDLKKNETKLHSALIEKWKNPAVNWNDTSYRNGILKKNGFSNGLSSNKTRNIEDWPILQVYILSPNEGRVAITEAARRIGENVLSGKLDANHIDEAIVAREIKLVSQERPIEDPELAVWCGSTCCNCGFLPWHIRVTQFLHIDTHHEIKAEDFISLLEAYSKCQQRFGK